MSKRAVVGEAEFLEAADYERFTQFPQDATDDVVGGVIDYPAHWSAYTVSRKSAQEITVSAGRYFEGDVVFTSETPTNINLIQYFPRAASDEKWVSLILRGQEEELREDRSFDTSIDPETELPVASSTPVVVHRRARVQVQDGSEVPPPASKPVIAATDACIAFVKITTTGIQTIEPGEKWRAKTLHEVEGRVTAIELRIERVIDAVETLQTDLGNVAASVVELRKSIPDARVFGQMVRDTARMSQVLNLPDEARNYWYDQALVKDDWDFSAGGFYRIDEGIRFQYVAQRDHILRLLNYDDPQLSIWNNQLVLPKYEEVTRITSPEGMGRTDISNTVHTITTAVQHTIAHERIRYGETVTVCENMSGWGAYADRKAGTIFQAGGETWVSGGATADPWNNTETAQNGHINYSAQRVIRDTYYETYTTYNTETFGLSGATHFNTFFVSQLMVATSIDLYFTKVGPTGDVTLCLCEIGPSGMPRFDGIIAVVTKPRSELKEGYNRFAFRPSVLDQGKRAAWFVVTSGNHQLMHNTGNAYTGGSKGVCTDGIWSQGTATEDFTFRVNGARFLSNRVVLPFQSLELAGGMTEIEMIFKAWSPAATQLVWEVKAQGDTEWIPMDARVDNPLANLPPLVQLRAVMIGTADVAPAILLDAYARAITGRMRPDMVAKSKVIPFGFATNKAQIVLNMDNYKSAKHTATPKLELADGTVKLADAIIAEIDPTKPSRTKFTANFTLPANTTGARVRVDATTTSVIDVPFGQDIQLNAY